MTSTILNHPVSSKYRMDSADAFKVTDKGHTKATNLVRKIILITAEANRIHLLNPALYAHNKQFAQVLLLPWPNTTSTIAMAKLV